MSAPSLAKSCSAFLHYNQLHERFAALFNPVGGVATGDAPLLSPFTIVALGFGSGVNVIATWQLWQTIEAHHQALSVNNDDSSSSMDKTVNKTVTINDVPCPRLHIICTEPSPLSHAELRQNLILYQQYDPALTPFITQILTLYPTLVSGCHRLHLSDEVTLDLWFGDTAINLANLDGASGAGVDAWFLDDVTSSDKLLTPPTYCTPPVVAQIQRLSKPSTTCVSKSSNAYDDAIKLGLTQAGFAIQTVEDAADSGQIVQGRFMPFSDAKHRKFTPEAYNHQNKHPTHQLPNSGDEHHDNLHVPAIVADSHIAIVGAGVSGLMAAWSLARRGLQVTLFDKSAPLSGASGNPRALLAPKMTPITHVAEHLHSISYLYSQRLYRQLNDLVDKPDEIEQPAAIFEPTALLDLLLKANIDATKIKQYPKDMAVVLNPQQAHAITGLEQQDLKHNLYLPQAGLVNPKALADTISAHPNITVVAATIKQISSQAPLNQSVKLSLSKLDKNGVMIEQQRQFDAVVIAAAYHSQALDRRIFDFRKIRGQLSWFEPSVQQLKALPKLPLKYNGYCALFIPQPGDDAVNPVKPMQPTFLLGASFVRNDIDTNIRPAEHQVSIDKLLTAIPEMRDILAKPKCADADSEGNNDDNRNREYDARHPIDIDTTIDITIKTSQPYETQDIDTTGWQARASIRAQTPDYHPLVGQVDEQGLVWTISGMGSKGFAFAPLCAEVLADKMTGQFAPLSVSLLARLDPKRKTLQTALK